MIKFIIGLMIGAPLGFFIAGLCVVSKMSDEQSERQFKEYFNKKHNSNN